MAARDVLAGEEAEGRPLEVLASKDEVGRRRGEPAPGGRGPAAARTRRRGREGSSAEGPCRASEDEVNLRAEDESRPPDVLAGEEAESWPPEVLADKDEGPA